MGCVQIEFRSANKLTSQSELDVCCLINHKMPFIVHRVVVRQSFSLSESSALDLSFGKSRGQGGV